MRLCTLCLRGMPVGLVQEGIERKTVAGWGINSRSFWITWVDKSTFEKILVGSGAASEYRYFLGADTSIVTPVIVLQSSRE